MSENASPTPVAPARPPSGFPLAHARYRNYVLFALTSVFMFVGGVGLLLGVRALGQGPEAWAQYLDALGHPAVLALSLAVFGFSVYFTLRWMWIGRKIMVGRVGPVPGPPIPMAGLGLGGIALCFATGIGVLLLLGGVL
ncbi:MAG: hypothetical protein J4G09_02660 [Proteobacteria bacterium]|nr:hypothetical protein [Pseudomonadota bacterium]